MKSTYLLGAVAILLAACGNEAPPPTTGNAGNGAGNSGGGSGSGPAGSGGGTAGVTGLAGATAGSGGSGTGVAGNGVAGSGVAGSGVAGSGVAGSGVAGTGGSASGAAGAAGSGGGAAGRGGAGGATGGTGGGGAAGRGGASGGAAGGTGGGATGTSIAGTFDGFLFLAPCNGGASSGYDCANSGCQGGTVTKMSTFQIGGTPGTVYNMTFHVRGVVEGYRYSGGTRDSGTTLQMQTTAGNDLFHRGGMQQATGASGSDYNTMQLDVTPAVSGESNRYFFNSIPVPPSDASASHLTFIIDFTKTIKITGGGTLTFASFDSNCRLVMNCETSSTNMCMRHWSVPSVSSTMPAPPATFMQPYSNGSGQWGQWMHIDVTDVVPVP
jgi:hypothetical protein